jgi:hypothetical protein
MAHDVSFSSGGVVVAADLARSRPRRPSGTRIISAHFNLDLLLAAHVIYPCCSCILAHSPTTGHWPPQCKRTGQEHVTYPSSGTNSVMHASRIAASAHADRPAGAYIRGHARATGRRNGSPLCAALAAVGTVRLAVAGQTYSRTVQVT